MAKRRKATRQDWKPNVLVRLVQILWTAAVYALKIALGAAATVAFIGIICCLVLVGTLGDYLQEDVVPNVSFNLDNYDLDQTSFIYYVDSDGQIQKMQQIYADTDRQWASYDEIPEDLVHAAIAIEDKRFYEHQGVDWITTTKACVNMFFGGSSTFGGSTITQQLIKNLTGEDSITVQRKVQEIFRAQKFEAQYDKETIMEWYLNTIYLGEGCSGVKSAAREYFGKELKDLTTAECASLISITNNPSLYDPYISEERNRTRQLIVLEQMYDQEWITEKEYEEAVAQEMLFTSDPIGDDTITYTCGSCGFEGAAREFDRNEDDTFSCPSCGALMNIVLDEESDMYSWYTELVLEDVAKALAEELGMTWDSTTGKACMNMIKKGGYHIYCCIDMEIQAIVDEIYTDVSNVPGTYSDQQLLSAIVVIDNRTGDIVAVSGSVGEKTAYDAFSYATDGGHQTGSSQKPLTVYAPAFELGVISPATVIDDLPLTSGFPLNDSRTYCISTTVMNGIMSSLNAVSVNVLDKIGTRYGFDFGKDRFGLEGLLEEEVLSNGYTLSDIGYSPLGMGALTYGVTVRDMASAYATFPNDGVIREDRTFTKVYDSEGNLILDNTQDSEQIMSAKAANYVNYCLRNVVLGGTGWYAGLDDTAAAGKTGTSSDNKDRWFCGYTEYYTAAVWCGYKVGEEIYLTGSNINPSVQMWKKVMSKIHDGVAWKDVYDTSGMIGVTVCLDSGGYATEACKADPRGNRVQSVYVYPEDAPGKTCDKHILVEYCTSGDGVANEYCKQVEGLTFSQVGLCKFTQSRIDEIKAAGRVPTFTDNIIYLIDQGGAPANFYGINGNINAGLSVPYKVCTVHTAESIVPETEPTDPAATDPAATDPAATEATVPAA